MYGLVAQGDVWSLGCALYKWTTGKEFTSVAASAKLQEELNMVPPSCGYKVKPIVPAMMLKA